MNLKLILVLTLSVLAVLFIAQNVAIVEISFLVWQTSMSSALLIFFTLVTGVLLGWFLHANLQHHRVKAAA
ncbi:lipopolysaccharide assembly protein LapA domain-containing protein [Quatrionicoccus australiensis]|uniref:lipopolysaccharide assembly protein LapA domain-containing protein n=1 Tax=Quatrionicoccus australiensis TaxID=138118 RepID=UPI001CFC2EAD|nr:LapA family protein [Quatrionicoccus australiensis]MCB4361882.1 LapA family protein [Quatrionicoccus australiensis]